MTASNDVPGEEVEDLFARNIAFWGKMRQESLAEESVFIGGAGALGCIVAEILVRSGIGRIYLTDRGHVDPPDLNRQILYTVNDIGKSKAFTAAERLRSMTGQTEVVPLALTIGEADIANVLGGCRGVADCLDNFPSRFALEDSLTGNMFMVSGAIRGDYGQLTTVIPGLTCPLRELYKGIRPVHETVPVIPSIVFCIGSLMAQEILMNIWGEPALLNVLMVAGLSGFFFERVALSPSSSPSAKPATGTSTHDAPVD